MKSWWKTGQFMDDLVESLNFAIDVDEEEDEVPRYVLEWLGRIRLLYGVPFEYLVPDERLLPIESVRFFYLDRSWTDRLVDGALSVGKTSIRDYAHHQRMDGEIRREADDEERVVRARLRGEVAQEGEEAEPAMVTGMLLRSRLVSGWPGMEVRAYPDEDSEGELLPLLRMERLAPGILLCLWEGVPAAVELEEPAEGVQFGTEIAVTEPVPPSGLVIDLRSVDPDSVGEEIKRKIPVPVRKTDHRVLHVSELQKAVRDALDDSLEVHSAHLAVQLLQGPYLQRFAGAASGSVPGGGGFVTIRPLDEDEFRFLVNRGTG